MKIETERLLLRNFTMDDAEDLYKVLGNAEVMVHVEAPYDFEKTKSFIKEYGMGELPFVYALEEKSLGKVIGHMVFRPAEEVEIYQIGWILGNAYWRKGYAYEMSNAMVKFGFEEMGLLKMVAKTDDPVKSLGLMKKLGMKLEGVQRKQSKYPNEWRDLYWCGILREDYDGLHQHAMQQEL